MTAGKVTVGRGDQALAVGLCHSFKAQRPELPKANSIIFSVACVIYSSSIWLSSSEMKFRPWRHVPCMHNCFILTDGSMHCCQYVKAAGDPFLHEMQCRHVHTAQCWCHGNAE